MLLIWLHRVTTNCDCHAIRELVKMHCEAVTQIICIRGSAVTSAVSAHCWLNKKLYCYQNNDLKERDETLFPLDYPTTSCTMMSSGGLANGAGWWLSSLHRKRCMEGTGLIRTSAGVGGSSNQDQGNKMGACVETWWVLLCHPSTLPQNKSHFV